MTKPLPKYRERFLRNVDTRQVLLYYKQEDKPQRIPQSRNAGKEYVMALNLNNMSTESRNPNSMELDIMTPLEVVTLMNNEDAKVAEAVRPALPNIAQCVSWAIESIRAGGRIIYMGAGTSGRLGILDAVECPPTFGVAPEVVVGLIAGGNHTFIESVESAEDSSELGREDLVRLNLEKRDIVIGIAASGRTPYVLGGLAYGREVGCRTVAVSCNPGSAIGQAAELAIEVVPGPEVLTGSTRLKAGTSQKMILNMISTATMVGCGKAYQNLMVDVMQTNEKLVVRAQNIVMEATGCDRETAAGTIAAAGGSVKTAVTMILADCGPEEARERLARGNGKVREAVR